MHWLLARSRALVETSHSPEAAFVRDLTGPSFVAPWLLLGLGFILLAFAQAPLQLDWTQHRMEQAGLSAAHIDSGLAMARKTAPYTPALVLGWLMGRWALFALALWIVAQVLLQNVAYARILTVVSFSYFPLLLRDAAKYLVLLLRPEDARLAADGMDVALGLDLLFPQVQKPWSLLAGAINPFEAWHVALLVIGMTKFCGRRWGSAVRIVLFAWLFSLATQVAFAWMGQVFGGES